jgi:poly(3-hydroxyalkanoate) synthetase
VHETPLIIFPPWINRFYILDLNPKKSFIRWAVEQGLTVFVVSWKSADETLATQCSTITSCAARSTRSTRCATC